MGPPYYRILFTDRAREQARGTKLLDPVAQWIEQWPSKPCARVRSPPGSQTRRLTNALASASVSEQRDVDLEALLRLVPYFRDLDRVSLARLAGALEPRERSRLLSAALAIAIRGVLAQFPPPAGLRVHGWYILLVLVGAGIAWLVEPVPDFAIALAMATAWGALGLAPLATVFSGFASSSWVLALGALALAAAMLRSGLLFRSALLLLRAFPATHGGQMLALLFGGIVLTPLVPLSVALVAAIAPLAHELGRPLGYRSRSRGSASLAFAGLIGYWYFSSIFLTGLATNFFVVGLLSPDDQRRFGWSGWLVAASPVGIACLVGALVVLFVVLRPEASAKVAAETVRRQTRILGPITRDEQLALTGLAVLVIGLIAQPILSIDAAWLGLAALVIVTGGGLDRARFRNSLDWGILRFLGLLLGPGAEAQ